MTKYPNLLAKYKAGNFGHISTLCERANVTEELMKAVLYNNAELSQEELKSIGYDTTYLTDPNLRTIDETDELYRQRIKNICEWAVEIQDKVTLMKSFYECQFKNIERLIAYYRSGKKIPVAIYRSALNGEEMVRYGIDELNKKAPRELGEKVISQLPPVIKSKTRKTNKPEISSSELTPIEVLLQIDKDGNVSAKKVYKFLELNPAHYARWCKKSILENEYAEENIDFTPFTINGECGGQATTDYKLTVSFAKKLCMLQKNERGEQARDYFIKVEETLKNIVQNKQPLTDVDKLIEPLLDKIQNLEKQLTEINSKIALVATPETSIAFDPLFVTPTLLYTTTAIGKAFGISARAVNRYLLAQNIHRPSGAGWVLNKKYADCNYVYQKVCRFTKPDNEKEEKIMTWWTPEGMEFVRVLLINTGLKQKSIIKPYNGHGNRGKRSKKESA